MNNIKGAKKEAGKGNNSRALALAAISIAESLAEILQMAKDEEAPIDATAGADLSAKVESS